MDDLLTTREAAELLNLLPVTLERWRTYGSGPPYLKVGRGVKAPVRYRRSELLGWLEAGRVNPEREPCCT